MNAEAAYLSVDGLRVVYRTPHGALEAVAGVSFDVMKGETFSLVGESGCGKSSTGRALVQLEPVAGGSVRLEGLELTTLRGADLRRARRRFQMVFQDPYTSLNPRLTVERILTEPLEIHRIGDRSGRRTRMTSLLTMVGLDETFARRLPRHLSGGQRQRVGIARALALEPELLVCDEPISALDVSIQAQVVTLLEELQQRLGLTIVFIAHDLAVVRHISDRVAVMYLGKLVETARVDDLFSRPLHPYTQALISAAPIPSTRVERRRKRIVLVGDVPSPLHPPPGCRFSTRCPYVQDRCRVEEPSLRVLADGHLAACHFAEDVEAGRLVPGAGAEAAVGAAASGRHETG